MTDNNIAETANLMVASDFKINNVQKGKKSL